MTPSPNWIRGVIGLFAAIMLLISLATGGSLDANFLRWASGAASAVVLIVLIYERWAWRWRGIRRAAEWAGRPVLHGTWRGELSYERGADGNPGTIPFFMAVDHTFSTIRIRSFVATSESNSLSAAIVEPARRKRQLVFAYRSAAPHDARDTNPVHDGTCDLNLVGIPVEEVVGSYYNDRLRRGSIHLAGVESEGCGVIRPGSTASYQDIRRSRPTEWSF